MTARNWVIAGFAASIAAIALMWWLDDDVEPQRAPQSVTREQTTPTDPATAQSGELSPRASSSDELERQSVEATVDDSKLAIVRGRCVDAQGNPLSGCKVDMDGWTGNDDRMNAWLLDHERPERFNPAALTTGDDGLFEFRFWPAPPFQFSLDMQAPSFATMAVRWLELAEGSVTDLGDVTMPPGIAVHGRVVDTDGIGMPNRTVSLRRRDDSDFGELGPDWGSQSRTDDRGYFRLPRHLSAGEHTIVVDDAIVTDNLVTLAANRPSEDLLVVAKLPEPTITIQGRVVDEDGNPVRSANVRDRADRNLPHGDSTDSSGAFQLQYRGKDASPPPAQLTVTSRNCICSPEAREVAWGSTDVEFVVKRGATLTLRITDEDNRPVDRFQVRLMREDRTSFSSEDNEPRTKGEHVDGTAVIAGLTPGDWQLFVDFPAATQLDLLMHSFSYQGNAPLRLDLRALREATRSVRVVGHDGQPVADARLQLCDLQGEELGPDSILLDRQSWLLNGCQYGMILCDVKTDANGRATLTGPGRRNLALRATSRHHRNRDLPSIRLDEEQELVIELGRGAGLRGRLTPPEALAELWRQANAASGPFAQHPHLTLMRDSEYWPVGRLLSDEEKMQFTIAEDGTFSAWGLPSGTWQVLLNYSTDENSRPRFHRFTIGTVALIDDRMTEQDFVITEIIPGTLDAEVLHNGEPLTNTVVTMYDGEHWEQAKTDDAGRFSTKVRPGTYELTTTPTVRSRSKAIVVRGQVTGHTFRLLSGTLKVTVRDAQGAAAANRRLRLNRRRSTFARTDANGEVELVLDAGETVLEALPVRLTGPNAHQEIAKMKAEAKANGIDDPWEAQFLEVARIRIRADQLTEHEFTLPAGY